MKTWRKSSVDATEVWEAPHQEGENTNIILIMLKSMCEKLAICFFFFFAKFLFKSIRVPYIIAP